MKVYEAVFNKEKHGQYSLSLVYNPAMEDEFILLSKQPNEIQFTAVDKVKNLLLGATLIPNKKILRKVGDNEFYVTFSVDVIEKIGHDFIRKGNQRNSKLEHKTELKDVSVVESWIVQDSKKDKSAIYGKNYEVGTLVQMMKVDDDTYGKAKNGEIKGFSIDALLGLNEIKLSEVKLNTDKMENNNDILDSIKALFSKSKGVDKLNTKIEELKTELSTQKDKFESDQKDVIADSKKEFEALQKTNEELKLELSKEKEAKEKEIEELKTKLSKTPEKEPIKRKEEKGHETLTYGRNRTQTTKDRVMERLFNLN